MRFTKAEGETYQTPSISIAIILQTVNPLKYPKIILAKVPLYYPLVASYYTSKNRPSRYLSGIRHNIK